MVEMKWSGGRCEDCGGGGGEAETLLRAGEEPRERLSADLRGLLGHTRTARPCFSNHQRAVPSQASATMSRRRGLLDLPNELLMMIKRELGPYDILGNMCYYTLCARTQACYDDMTDDEWKLMVRASGLGLVRDEVVVGPDWEDIALECAEHAYGSDPHEPCVSASLA